jgi:hypothetical protein
MTNLWTLQNVPEILYYHLHTVCARNMIYYNKVENKRRLQLPRNSTIYHDFFKGKVILVTHKSKYNVSMLFVCKTRQIKRENKK